MMALELQLIGIFFGIFMIYYTFLHYKRSEFSRQVFSLWMLIWILFIAIVLFPELLRPLVSALNFTRLFDLLTVIGFIFLMVLVFYNFTIVRKNENKIEEVVRKVALTEAKVLNKKKR